jgi:sialic acid synthase
MTTRQTPFVIAEIGCNHMGDFDIALKLIDAALASGCNAAKFQKRNVKECLPPAIYNGPHPNPHNSYGDTYGEHREKLELTNGEHKKLFDYCKSKGIEYSCTPFDLTSADFLINELGIRHLKIASFHNNHYELINYICKNHPHEIHISLGMISDFELDTLQELLEENKAMSRTVLYNCTSNYPCPFEDLHLEHITYLSERFGEAALGIGFSGHHQGIAVDLCAYTLGATYFERHFTLDRTWKGTDHAASLQPEGMRKLIRDLNAARLSLTPRPSGILQSESHNRSFHKFSTTH